MGGVDIFGIFSRLAGFISGGGACWRLLGADNRQTQWKQTNTAEEEEYITDGDRRGLNV